MEYITIVLILALITYSLYSLSKRENAREIELNYHLSQAKRLISGGNINDKLKWNLERFNQAEDHLLEAQAACISDFEFRSILDIRKKMRELRNNFNN